MQNDILKEKDNNILTENEKYKSLQKQLNENKEKLNLSLEVSLVLLWNIYKINTSIEILLIWYVFYIY